MARHRPARPTNPTRRRLAAAMLAVIGVAGLSVASASQLALNGGSLGAGTATVAICQTSGAIKVSFTTTFSGGAYQATHVVLSNVDGACRGLAYKVQLVNGSGTALGAQVTGTVPAAGAGPFTLTTALPVPQPVSSIVSVAVVIQS